MKQILIILGLFASVTTFAQSPRIKLNQITKDTVKGSVLISSPSDSGMVYSRDFYVAYGADTVLILYGDTLGGVGGGFASVLSDGVTITGDGTTGNELKVDTSTVISTIQGLVDTLTARGYLVSSDLTNYVTTNTSQTISGAKTFTSDLNIDAKIALNDGGSSVFIGDDAGRIDDGTDNRNIGIGHQVLYNDTTGSGNVAVGFNALYTNSSGYDNIANGFQALYLNKTGYENVANGFAALFNNTVGYRNLAMGAYALFNLSSGVTNQAYGYNSGRYIDGGSNLTTANGSLFLGTNTRASADNNSNEIVIGTNAIGNGTNSITLGASSNAKVVLNGVGSTGGTNSALYITSTGELTTNSSDERLKTNINSLDSELNTLLNLNPVKYNYYDDLENDAIGFIAQELEIYYPNLVFTNPVSNYKGVHYHLFAPILVKAIQEQQQKITDLETTIQSLITRIENLENK